MNFCPQKVNGDEFLWRFAALSKLDATNISHVDEGGTEPATNCPLCQLSLGSTECFDSHTRRRVEGEDVRYDCLICGYTTSQKSHMKLHIRTHTGEKPFSCPHCPYRAAQRAHVKSHLRFYHSGELSSLVLEGWIHFYMLFQRLSAFIYNELHCTGKELFSCPHCQYSATQQVRIKDHIRTCHSSELSSRVSGGMNSFLNVLSKVIAFIYYQLYCTGKKLFSCPHCQHKAGKQTHLTRHVETRHSHDGEFPYLLTSYFISFDSSTCNYAM